MIPLQGVALDKQYGKESKDNKRYDLLNNLQLPQGEGAAKLLAADTVGGDLKTVLKKGDTPTDEHNTHNAVTLELRLKGYMTIPCQCHKDI